MGANIFAELNAAISASEPPAPPKDVPPAPIITTGQPPKSVVKALARSGLCEFPEIPPDFGQPPEVRPAAVNAVPAISVDRSERLESLVDKALEKTGELLNIELDPMDENFVKVASMQKDLVVSLINTGVKVDENRFKKRQADNLTGILAALLDKEEKLKPLIDLAPTVPN